MKVGSLVIFLGMSIDEMRKDITLKWLPEPKTEIVTIKEIIESLNGPGARFEENIIGHTDSGLELAIDLPYLREVQGPEEGAIVISLAEPEPEMTY